MARTDNLSNFLTDVANAIRTKTGGTGQIQASQFDTEIENIENVSSVIYFDVAPEGSGKTITFDIASNYSNYSNITLDNIIAMPSMGVSISEGGSTAAFTWSYEPATGVLSLTVDGRFSTNSKQYLWRIAII